MSSGRRAKGAKRDPRLLQALTDKLGDYIKKNPGLRIEQIGKALGTPTKDLALPVKKLVAAKKISTKGQKRATTYFAKLGNRRPLRGFAAARGREGDRPSSSRSASRAVRRAG